MYSFPIVLCLRMAAVGDPDVWWHLRSGEWMLQHGVVPRTETERLKTPGMEPTGRRTPWPGQRKRG
jgi:hypothetical protein